jgi:Putative auto-transporter adhesin, head GIN domain
MKKNLLLSIPLLAFVLLLSSFLQSERITGNGDVKQEDRQATTFKNIGTSGTFKVYITQGNTHSIRIEAESNLLPYIETKIDGEDLEVRVKKGYNLKPTKDVNVYVTLQEVRELAASGSGGFYSKTKLKTDKLELAVSGSADADLDVTSQQLEVGVSGASNVKLRGSATKAEYSISGKADIQAFDFQAQEVEIAISGSGNANVNAQKKLDIAVSGMGNIKYKGNPEIKQSVSGMGKIAKEG